MRFRGKRHDDGRPAKSIWGALYSTPFKGFAVVLLILATGCELLAATVAIDGAQTYQVIDGFGVNANHRNWTNNELQPVLDALLNQAGLTIFRVVYDNTDWEEINAYNPNPTNIN